MPFKSKVEISQNFLAFSEYMKCVCRSDDSITLKTLVWLSFSELRRRERLIIKSWVLWQNFFVKLIWKFWKQYWKASLLKRSTKLMWLLHNLKNSHVAVFQRAQKKGERVYLFGAPAKATVEAEEEACGLATKNEDQSNIFLTRRVHYR